MASAPLDQVANLLKRVGHHDAEVLGARPGVQGGGFDLLADLVGVDLAVEVGLGGVTQTGVVLGEPISNRRARSATGGGNNSMTRRGR